MSGGNDKLERELESLLGDDSRVAALYRRLPKDEPDARLDAAILAQARAAVAPRRARPRWLPAMSAAAAIVLAAGLAYRVGPQVWKEHSAVSEQTEQRVAAPASPAQQPPAVAAPQSTVSTTPLPPAESSKESALATQVVTGTSIRRVDINTAQTDKLQSAKRKAEEQKTTSDAFAKQSAQSQMQAEARRDRSVSNAPAGAARAQPEHAQKSAAAEPPRMDAAPPPTEASPATPATLATPAAKPAAAPQPDAFPAAANATYAPASPAPASRAPARESAPTVADIESTLYPEHWISDIRQMLKDGRRDDAIRNLTAFRKRYPDYTLPEDLRDLK